MQVGKDNYALLCHMMVQAAGQHPESDIFTTVDLSRPEGRGHPELSAVIR